MEPPTVNFSRDLDIAEWWHAELKAIVRDELKLSNVLAEKVSEVILCGMRKRIGGQEVYVPAQDKGKRNEAIKAFFNGRNMDEVCRMYGVSPDTVYRACK